MLHRDPILLDLFKVVDRIDVVVAIIAESFELVKVFFFTDNFALMIATRRLYVLILEEMLRLC